MNSEDETNLQDELNEALLRLGLEGWEAVWSPDPSQKVNGQVLSEQKTIIVFSKDPKKAMDILLHEAVEVMIQPLIAQYQETINGLIKIIERLTYREKERTINEIVPCLRHVYEDGEE